MDLQGTTRTIKVHLVTDIKVVEEGIHKFVNEKVVQRFWEKDYTVWSNKPDEITNRLNWLDSPSVMRNNIQEITNFVDEIRNEGIKNVVILGMGGSSLAPEVYAKTFGTAEGYPDVEILDSTHPDSVKSFSEKFSPEETLYIVSTKSGGTVETISFMKYFYNYVIDRIGKEKVNKHFAAITDPGSGLEEIARQLKFRKIFLNDPNIGGRYSALSFFGLVPAAFVGININKLIERAIECAEQTKHGVSDSAVIGIIMGELAKRGKDKLTFLLSDKTKYFCPWVEQLIAESTGKSGHGILPVEGEDILTAEEYGDDRLFVYMHLEGENSLSKSVQQLKSTGFPLIEIVWNDLYDLSREYFNWEFATAVAGWDLGIQPFDQPNVESAKVQARKMMKEYYKKGSLPVQTPNLEFDDLQVFGDITGNSLGSVINNFIEKNISRSFPGSYIALQAYQSPNERTISQLNKFRMMLEKKYSIPVTIGYGPRFLHSTGQLHKGDAGNGIFIQITEDIINDIPIPDNAGESKSSITFGTLITAQALGDREALIENQRNVLRINFTNNADISFENLLKSL